MPTIERKQECGTHAAADGPGAIVVGCDGNRGGGDAVALAIDLAGHSGRRILTEHIPGPSGTSLGLIGLAEREEAGTIVVGSPPCGCLGRALLGSVAHHVLLHAPCEVIVAPRGYAEHDSRTIAKIAVAFDGTAEARAALRRAEALAGETGASLHLVVAEDPIVAGIGTNDELNPLTSAQAVLTAALASVDPAIEATGTHLDPGRCKVGHSTAEAIAAACVDGVDILVAGTRKPLDRLLLGSATGHLIDLAPCPVLVVPYVDEHPVRPPRRAARIRAMATLGRGQTPDGTGPPRP